MSVKSVILQQYDHFHDLKKHNPEIKTLVENKEQISKQITLAFARFRATGDKNIAQQLEDLHQRATTLDEKYTDIMKKELNVLYQKWPDLFKQLINQGIDRETLDHVLTMYERYNKGQISSEQAISQGLDFMTNKYGLPTNFFIKDSIPTFNQNLHLFHNNI
ncbi:MAG: hypothetical protein ABIN35_00320 [candidate division WOR-3 bacterium]